MPNLLPDGDLAGTGSWLGLGGGALYSKVNSGPSADDATFIYLNSGATPGTGGVTLGNPGGTPDTASSVTLRYRVDGYDGGVPGSISVTISLVEGGISGTTRATKSETVTINAVETFTDGSLVVATPGGITDWNDLCVVLNVTSWGPTTGEVRFSEIYLEYSEVGAAARATRRRHLPVLGAG